jgi:hypothetical protein
MAITNPKAPAIGNARQRRLLAIGYSRQALRKHFASIQKLISVWAYAGGRD